MRRHLFRSFVCALVSTAALASWAVAQERAPAAAGGGGDAVIAPFVDEATVAVARVDVPAVHPEAVQAWVSDQLKAAGAKPDELDRGSKQMQETMVGVKQWQADFAAAGGRVVYLIARVAAENGGSVGFQTNYFVIPLEPNADTRKLTELMTYPLGLARPPKPAAQQPPPGGAPETGPFAGLKGETIGGALVVSGPDNLERLKKQAAPPAARPEIARALAASGGGAVRVAVAPSEAVRAAIAFAMPKLPPELGGGPSTPLSQGVQWIALGIDAPPNGAARLTVQATDAASAGKLHDLIETAFRSLRAQPGFPKDASLDKAMTTLTPQVAGDQLKLTLDPAKVTELARALGPVLERQREQAKRSLSMNNLRQLAIAAIMYSNDHKGQLPAKYPDDLKPYLEGGFEQVQANPSHPDRRPGYVYVRPADTLQKLADPARAVLFHEAYDPKNWADGIGVAFADGHVEFVYNRPAFEQMLKQPAKP